eukprot:TRINITY_DN1351_c0_g1_i1.p1 TRINITY_DN1351_c0_g1~~TRINITY_DN1351_c0_g1_i1.p1  ORF type:complete len:258 (+),score=56.53 TRINITY_DN1351_c0_g1_i1:651-1424(+)
MIAVAGISTGDVELWDTAEFTRLRRGAVLRGHHAYVGAVANHGTTLATGSRDDTVRLWDIFTEQCTTVVPQQLQSEYVSQVWLESDHLLTVAYGMARLATFDMRTASTAEKAPAVWTQQLHYYSTGSATTLYAAALHGNTVVAAIENFASAVQREAKLVQVDRRRSDSVSLLSVSNRPGRHLYVDAHKLIGLDAYGLFCVNMQQRHASTNSPGQMSANKVYYDQKAVRMFAFDRSVLAVVRGDAEIGVVDMSLPPLC